MKSARIFLLLFTFFFAASVSFGQFNILKKAKEKVKERAERKVDEGMDKGLDKAEEEATKTDQENTNSFKNFNIKLMEIELSQINGLRQQRPKPRGQKRPGISLQEWLLEAIHEKIEREKEKYYTHTQV